ncbi:hypothetical protein CERZMDRAFT_90579 [Cercospora zeae-maydis SCOH1-5]|uniref:Uncharacterized protein n=1 Tax=Cercospora zeae-maydis SCOH1-5 TaxID=717836 RepID=A0A6A6FI71_9PEZI|nr:hypothetical protein CERZMDRAFT_90579 [Cercospora zeae-maydis SCOH1-5]
MLPTRKPSIDSATIKQSPLGNSKHYYESPVDYYFGIIERALQTRRPSVHLYFLNNNKHPTPPSDNRIKHQRSLSLSE